MSSFDPDKWVPASDSSPNWIDYAVLKDRVAIDVSDDRCMCGCRSATGSRFVPGHDARLKGKLIRAHLMDKMILFYPDHHPVTAVNLADRFGWSEWLVKAERRRWEKCLELTRRAEDDRMNVVQAGVWERTGMPFVIFRTKKPQWWRMEYVDRAGKSKRLKLEADDA